MLKRSKLCLINRLLENMSAQDVSVPEKYLKQFKSDYDIITYKKA